MGWNDIGYQSTDLQAVTPNLNKMATAGVTVRVCVRVCVQSSFFGCCRVLQ